MKLHFLGTNGWYDTKLGNTLSVLLDTDKAYVVFDAGGGFYKLDKYIKNNKPIILLLSHFHLDHIIGLHTLNKFRFAQGIDIYGPPGLKTLFKKVINKPYTIPIRQLHFRVRLHEIGHSVLLPEGIHYKSLKHSTVCYGYTVLGEGKKLAFCTDTGLCKNLILLVQDSD
ncbi:MAG: ribonuclease Z, partial [Candidatus Omnitrophica bacterium]|nr:ribonuclease Z [Candidatus Omnitrophota bacterium]